MILRIYNQDDRLEVAKILIKNGYTVSQLKKPKTGSKTAIDYCLRVEEDEGNASTAK